MKEDYKIEDLKEIFKKHSTEFEEKYHDNPYKDENYEYFNLSNALHVICKEINEIKRQISDDISCESLKNGKI
jgi:hypothetical protein